MDNPDYSRDSFVGEKQVLSNIGHRSAMRIDSKASDALLTEAHYA